jgi:NRAMP (natural resistance-associated macrophage protein)-like metal ion transporter
LTESTINEKNARASTAVVGLAPSTVGTSDDHEKKPLTHKLGPGLITGASDDDPSGIGTYATAGAAHGYALLWMAPVCYPLMSGVQLTCARIGMVSGMGLAGVLRTNYPAWLLYPAIAMLAGANSLNAGADIGAIADGINLLAPLPHSLLIVAVAILIVSVQVLAGYKLIARIFKWSALSLLAYVGAGLLAKPDWSEVLKNTIVPHIQLNQDFLTAIVAILGTTISPYLFFWQTSQEVEEEEHKGRLTLWSRQGATRDELQEAALDTEIGMFVAVLVMYFIMLATAATLHAEGQTSVDTAAEAAQALEPLAGSAAKILFAVGIIGTGLLAVPVLTGAAAYAVAEGFGWPRGLDEKPARALGFYAVIIVSTLVGLTINFAGIGAMTALYIAAVVNGLLAPPLLILILLMANNQRVMGDLTNSPWLNRFGVVTAVLMSGAALALVGFWVMG